jgi:hypothetical protein
VVVALCHDDMNLVVLKTLEAARLSSCPGDERRLWSNVDQGRPPTGFASQRSSMDDDGSADEPPTACPDGPGDCVCVNAESMQLGSGEYTCLGGGEVVDRRVRERPHGESVPDFEETPRLSSTGPRSSQSC